MKLFYSAKTRSFRPRWMLEEMGIPYELVTVDLKKGEQKGPDYLKVNPMGAVPALQDGEVTFFESAAIVCYLADKFPEKKLAPPTNSTTRARYYQWMFFSMTSLDPHIVGVFYHTTLLPEPERIPAYLELCKKNLSKSLAVLTTHLKDQPYMLGQDFSAVDIMVGSNLSFAKALKLLEDQPVLLDYTKRLSARPAFQKALG